MLLFDFAIFLNDDSTIQKLIVPKTPNTTKIAICACKPKCDEYTKLVAAAIDYVYKLKRKKENKSH